MKSLGILYLLIFFNVSVAIFSSMGVFVQSSIATPTLFVGIAGKSFLAILISLGAGLVTGRFVSWVTGGGINPMSVIFFSLYTGLWTANINMLTSYVHIGLSWFSVFLVGLGIFLAFVGAVDISIGYPTQGG